MTFKTQDKTVDLLARNLYVDVRESVEVPLCDSLAIRFF